MNAFLLFIFLVVLVCMIMQSGGATRSMGKLSSNKRIVWNERVKRREIRRDGMITDTSMELAKA